MDNKFIILVTQRDAKPFIRKCLDSIVMQTYKNYFVIIMDDCSTDGTWEIIQEYTGKYDNFQAIRNDPKRTYQCKNFVAAINAFATKREDVIVFLSGDDWFYSDDVLEHLNRVYQDDIWMTYGSFIPSSGKFESYCAQITDTRAYRRSRTWLASHLVTCKKKLWKRIRDEDLRYKNGEYPNNSFDCAFLYPMIEMSGLKHMKFIDKILYVYNDQNPIAEEHFKEDPGACGRERRYWTRRPQYKELRKV